MRKEILTPSPKGAGCRECGGHEFIGVEYEYTSPEHYDGVSEWLCANPQCGARFGRWTGKRLGEEELEPRYGETR